MAFGRSSGTHPDDIRATGFDPRQDLRSLLLGFEGRIHRTTYAWTFVLGAAWWVGSTPLSQLAGLEPQATSLLQVAIGAPGAWLASSAVAKRAHDLGLTGWIAVFLVVPPVRWTLAFLLVLPPSEQAWNRYGAPPKPPRFRWR